ncbi:MAG: LamG-like jellyroll fold domain-containing protein, partial [Alphaproteobacteria bacterium]|nr:LamG-like jellyroll fold domain-containing protein [Alphaproteobacteria bacterium]
MPGNNLTLISPNYATTGQKFGTAALNGGYGLAPTGLVSNAASFTAEGWAFRAPGASSIRVIFGQAQVFWVGHDASGNLAVNIGGGGGAVSMTIPATNICNSTWNHLALTVDVSTGLVQIFLNGTSVASQTMTAAIASMISGAQYGVRSFTINSATFAFEGLVDEVALFSGVRYSSNFTAPTAAYLGSETNLVGLWSLESNGNDTSGAAVSNDFAATNAAFLYSPANWLVSGGVAKSINPGAYFRIGFTGATCTLRFDITNQPAERSVIAYRIDGLGQWIRASVAATVVCTMPSETSGQTNHTLEVIFVASGITQNRWNSPQNTAVVFNGITLASGGTVFALRAYTRRVLFYGDSITEGIRTITGAAADDVSENDARVCWAYETGRLLGVDAGIIGLGGQGLSVGGVGNVPAMHLACNLLWAGQSRDFTGTSMVVVMQGANDGATNTTANWTSFLNTMLAAIPAAAKIVI